MDWINQAACHTDPDPDLWGNWRLEKRANAEGSNSYGGDNAPTPTATSQWDGTTTTMTRCEEIGKPAR
eukprot:16273985-Heterocapsa_arctica.AAC.1